jgi:ribonuclease Z
MCKAAREPARRRRSLSADLGTTVESLDHPVDNAPVRSLAHKGLTVEGYSRAAVQTYWRIPELKLGFDLGAQPCCRSTWRGGG